jgi:hypothetical protein
MEQVVATVEVGRPDQVGSDKIELNKERYYIKIFI